MQLAVYLNFLEIESPSKVLQSRLNRMKEIELRKNQKSINKKQEFYKSKINMISSINQSQLDTKSISKRSFGESKP